MKNLFKSFGLIAIIAVIGFTVLSITGCPAPDPSNGNDGDTVPKTLSGTVRINPSTGVTTGTQLTANYSGSEAVSYLWKKGETNIGTNSITYTPSESGNYTVTVSAEGYNSKTSAPVTVTGASLPVLTGTVSITGIAEVGQLLTANTNSLDGNGAIAYQWKWNNGTTIGTNSSSYTVQSADIGSTITVTVTRSGYSGSVTSAPTVIVTGEAQPALGLAFTPLNGGTAWSVSRGMATASEVVIPAIYEGKPVIRISYNGFSSYTNLTSITIPNSVTSIESQAFTDCSNLSSVTIGSGVTSIGSYAFSSCRSLTSVTIGNSVGSIGNGAFADCRSLTSITIPNSVTSIGEKVLSGCTNLTSITIPFVGRSLNGTSDTHFGYIFGTSDYYYPISISPKTVIITGGKNIAANAFYFCTSLTSVTIESGVTSIGEKAFAGCSGLTSITIPNSVTSIGSQAFADCSSLTSVTIPNSVTSISSQAFAGCSSLTSVTIPNSVTSIGDRAFADCRSLTSITIPNSVTSIGDSAFRDCRSLTSVTIGSGVTSIGKYAFIDCTGLTSINFNATAMADLTNLSYVFRNAGKNADGLTVNIGANVKKVPAYLFFGGYKGGDFHGDALDTKITTVNFAAGSVCQSIGGYAFLSSPDLTSVTIPNSVTSIGYYAFALCNGLTSVTFQGTIASENFDGYAFTTTYGYIGDIRNKFYETNATNGTPGTYTKSSGSNTWTRI
jgi:Flp pilus assembly protein protease CpaA